MLRQFPRLLTFALALLVTPHCAMNEAETSADTSESGDEPSAGVVLSAASWKLEWDTEGLTLDPSGGWSVTTNLGYRVRVDRGFHVSHGVSLSKCPASAEASLFSGLVRSAYAHTTDEDASAIETLVISDLAFPRETELGASSFEPARYCRVFFLLARGMPGAVTKDGLDMSNRSLFFSGTWSRGASQGKVEVDTWWPQGKREELDASIETAVFERAKEDGKVRFAFVSVRLPLGRAFDNIELEEDSEAVLEDRVIDNLTEGARFVVDLGAP